MQAQRDKTWTTLQLSVLGNFAGIGVVRLIHGQSDKWASLRHVHRRETLMALSFLLTVGAFTAAGYDKARREFTTRKLQIVAEHSVACSHK